MTATAPLTDRDALARNRARAARRGPALFLHEAAAAEVNERLSEVNRRFTDAAVVTAFAAPWQHILPNARIVDEAEHLSLTPGAHDLIVHALSLHWANDPLGQLIQCRRALRPDGLMLAVAFGGQTLVELRSSLAEAESRLAGGLAPRVLPMAELRDLGDLLPRAGFALPVADVAPLRVSYADTFALFADLRAMGEGNAMSARSRRWPGRELFALAARIYAENFAGPDGRIRTSFDMVCLTGWAPDPSQPQPLRPGSASHRLTDVLSAIAKDQSE